MLEIVDTFITIIALIVYALIIGVVIVSVALLYFKKSRERYEKSHQYNLTFLQIKLPPQNEYEIAAAEHFFASLAGLRKGFWDQMKTGQYRLSFEIISKEEGIGFFVVVPDELAQIVEKQINADYPTAEIDIIDPEEVWDRGNYTSVVELVLAGPAYYPIKTYEDLGADAINALTTATSKLNSNEVVSIQYIVRPASDNWRKAGLRFISKIRSRNAEGKSLNVDEEFLKGVEGKLNKPGYDVVIRLISISSDAQSADNHLQAVTSAFSQFTDVRYNKFKPRKWYSADKIVDKFIYRQVQVVDWFIPFLDIQVRRNTSVLNVEELATVFHFPNKDVQTPNIEWLGARKSAAPTHVPNAGLYLGSSVFRGVRKEIYMAPEDRRRHMYIIGQTGTGKSELLKGLALQDIAAGNGLAVIDPHGSDIEDILQRIPQERMEDVILFDVSDIERPLGINILEAQTVEQQNMIINSFIALLYKIYDPNKTGMIGPQLERTVRNVMLTAMAVPGSTMIDVLRLVIDTNYSKKFLPAIQDPLVKRYWTDEIAKTSDFHKSEKMGYFVSKFDRFVTERTMRNIIGQPNSSFDFAKMMAEKKIFLADLSKGKIGEENSTFLGLLLVPRILMAALARANLGKTDFPDFFLYVDEFQNFATPDFATILSEARKYRLDLIVANQFIGQLSEEIKEAVFGNVGTLVSFRIGSDDAQYLAHQFEPIFEENDLINIPVGNAYMRLLVNGQPTIPFSMNVDWDKEQNDLSTKYSRIPRNEQIAAQIREMSRQKYGRPVAEVEAYINERVGLDAQPKETKLGEADAGVQKPKPALPF